jgi:hypothetical protein
MELKKIIGNKERESESIPSVFFNHFFAERIVFLVMMTDLN